MTKSFAHIKSKMGAIKKAADGGGLEAGEFSVLQRKQYEYKGVFRGEACMTQCCLMKAKSRKLWVKSILEPLCKNQNKPKQHRWKHVFVCDCVLVASISESLCRFASFLIT